jgi:hypothetical protein
MLRCRRVLDRVMRQHVHYTDPSTTIKPSRSRRPDLPNIFFIRIAQPNLPHPPDPSLRLTKPRRAQPHSAHQPKILRLALPRRAPSFPNPLSSSTLPERTSRPPRTIEPGLAQTDSAHQQACPPKSSLAPPNPLPHRSAAPFCTDEPRPPSSSALPIRALLHRVSALPSRALPHRASSQSVPNRAT